MIESIVHRFEVFPGKDMCLLPTYIHTVYNTYIEEIVFFFAETNESICSLVLDRNENRSVGFHFLPLIQYICSYTHTHNTNTHNLIIVIKTASGSFYMIFTWSHSISSMKRTKLLFIFLGYFVCATRSCTNENVLYVYTKWSQHHLFVYTFFLEWRLHISYWLILKRNKIPARRFD